MSTPSTDPANERLPVTDEDWAKIPPAKQLEPDAEDLRLASTTFLKPCPFCGHSGPIASGRHRQERGLFGYSVSCTNFRCNASVRQNADTRVEARRLAVEQWQTRWSGK